MHKHHVLRVGLTGGIGSGKSTVCRMFAKLGVPVIDADEIAHELTSLNQDVRQSILQSFGRDLLGSSGHLDRLRLRNLVFNDDVARNKLENILHPLIYEEIESRIKSVRYPYCIICIPLLVETKGQKKIDRVLVIDVPETLQIQRAVERDHTNREDIMRIMQAQCTRRQRLSAADDVIHNDGDLAYLEKQVYMLHEYYNKIAAGNRSLTGSLDE